MGEIISHTEKPEEHLDVSDIVTLEPLLKWVFTPSLLSQTNVVSGAKIPRFG